jgi:sn-glycerol 3-phosphate transport system ATP-binding protein
VFLFDEPLSNLDAKLRAATRLEIRKLHAELGRTSLFVTHDQVEAMTLGQRLIVMNAGRIEQIGTPEQVYAQPASRFVAGFIGSPPMNLLAGRAEGSGFVLGGQTLALEAPAPRPGALTLGVRPEHARLDEAGTWSLRVEMVELLGAERLVHGFLGGMDGMGGRADQEDASFTLRIDASQPSPRAGQRLPLRLPPERLHWFDPTSGLRL